MKRAWSLKERELLIELWPLVEGKEVARRLGRSYNSVKGMARKLGVRGRSISTIKRKYQFNDESFSDLNNLETYYWAGFLAADGYINDKRKHLVCALSTKDQRHLRKLSKFLKNKKPLAHIHSNGKPQVRMEIYGCLKIISDLKSLGVDHRKIRIYPKNISRRDALVAFVAGLLDGDGSLIWSASQLKYIQFCQQSKRLARLVQKTVSYGRLKKLTPQGKVWVFGVGNPACSEFRREVLRLPLPLLTRKWKNK